MCAAVEFKFLPLSSKFVAFRFTMTANVQGSNILDVLKKKMRATKEECEKYREDCEDLHRKLQAEIARREEVRERLLPGIRTRCLAPVKERSQSLP